ncbi:MAG TPA: RNA-binding S4 domain-containing protein [Pyrinomonadaceae bacterium]|nr:RNA-binding S4 domain-containing protein [Pyrinomonadaceae bacterium]
MRLDLFLKSSRLCLRRTVAQKMCDAGLVLVNGKVAKAATTVKTGDELSLRRRERITTKRVLALPSARQTSRSDAASLYEILDEIRVAGE